MNRDQIAAVSHDLIGVLHDLEFLVPVVAMQPHAFTDHLENVDDAERPVPLMRAKVAMIGMVNRNQRIDTGIARRLELPQLQFALELGQHADIRRSAGPPPAASDRPARHRGSLQDFGGGFHDTGDAGMPVQRNAHVDAAPDVRLQFGAAARQEIAGTD